MYKEKILEILEEINPKVVKYKGNNLVSDGILESVEMMELVDALEEFFEIEIGPKYIIPEYFETVEDIERLIKDIKDNE